MLSASTKMACRFFRASIEIARVAHPWYSSILLNRASSIFCFSHFAKRILSNTNFVHEVNITFVPHQSSHYLSCKHKITWRFTLFILRHSHQYILSREAEYLGVDINQDNVQALIDEITSLRNEILGSQQIIKDLTKK